jgi:nicotinamidase/pyrazinamidase
MKTVFFDVDTQIDFLFPAGALYVPGAERLLPALDRLTRFAESHAVPVVSTADAHAENDPEFRTWPAHCVAGTWGQRRPAATLLAAGAAQHFVEKQALDCFTNQNLPVLLQTLAAERFVVYGVVTECCVRCAVFGLLKTGARVELVEDATQSLRKEDGERTVKDFLAAGGVLTSVARVTGA